MPSKRVPYWSHSRTNRTIRLIFLLLYPSDLSHFLRTIQERIALKQILSRPQNRALFRFLNKC